MSVGGYRLVAWQDLKVQKKGGSRSLLKSLTFQRSYASLLPLSPPFCSSCYLFYLFLSLHFSWLLSQMLGADADIHKSAQSTNRILPLPAPRLHPVCGINSASYRTPYLPQTAKFLGLNYSSPRSLHLQFPLQATWGAEVEFRSFGLQTSSSIVPPTRGISPKLPREPRAMGPVSVFWALKNKGICE